MTVTARGVKIVEGQVVGWFAIDRQQTTLPCGIGEMATPESDFLCGDIVTGDGLLAGLVAPGEWITVRTATANGQALPDVQDDPHYLAIDFTFGTELAELTREFATMLFRMHSSLDIRRIVEGPSRVGRTRLADTTIVFFWNSETKKMKLLFDYAEHDIIHTLFAESAGLPESNR